MVCFCIIYVEPKARFTLVVSFLRIEDFLWVFWGRGGGVRGGVYIYRKMRRERKWGVSVSRRWDEEGGGVEA